MRLSLSVRIAEASDRKDKVAVPVETLAPLAAKAGFAGLSLRPSVISVDTPPERRVALRALLDANGLSVSMVTGNLALVANSADAPDCLRAIEPHLDLAAELGSPMIRVMLHDPADIPVARMAAEKGAARGIGLAQQIHWGSLCETVDEALELVHAVGHPNFGITYEPANLMACSGKPGRASLERLAPYLANVYFQNIVIDLEGGHRFRSRHVGPVGVRYLALDDDSGLDGRNLIRDLRAVCYEGWFTIHQPLRAGQTVNDAISEAARVFASL